VNVEQRPVSRNSKEWRRIRKEILERDGNRCVHCSYDGGEDGLNVHHILAVYEGGNEESENLSTLCWTCHREWESVNGCSSVSYDEWVETPPWLALRNFWIGFMEKGSPRKRETKRLNSCLFLAELEPDRTLSWSEVAIAMRGCAEVLADAFRSYRRDL